MFLLFAEIYLLFSISSARFSALLFLEELAIEAEINSFRLSGVTLTRRGEFLVLNVPGLSDGKPSLLIGRLQQIVRYS